MQELFSQDKHKKQFEDPSRWLNTFHIDYETLAYALKLPVTSLHHHTKNRSEEVQNRLKVSPAM